MRLARTVTRRPVMGVVVPTARGFRPTHPRRRIKTLRRTRRRLRRVGVGHRLVLPLVVEHVLGQRLVVEHRPLPGLVIEHRPLPGLVVEHVLGQRLVVEHRPLPGLVVEHVAGLVVEHILGSPNWLLLVVVDSLGDGIRLGAVLVGPPRGLMHLARRCHHASLSERRHPHPLHIRVHHRADGERRHPHPLGERRDAHLVLLQIRRYPHLHLTSERRHPLLVLLGERRDAHLVLLQIRRYPHLHLTSERRHPNFNPLGLLVGRNRRPNTRRNNQRKPHSKHRKADCHNNNSTRHGRHN